MRKYLSTLPHQSDHHKKRFALLASGTITLFIFGLWSLATFGLSGINFNPDIFARKNEVYTASVKVGSEVSPLQSLWLTLATSFESIKGSFGELMKGAEEIDFEAEYRKVEMGTLEIYGE